MENLETAERGEAPAAPAHRILLIVAGFLLPVLLGLLAACLGGAGPRSGAGAPGRAELAPVETVSSAWQPCGAWYVRPGYDRGCRPA